MRKPYVVLALLMHIANALLKSLRASARTLGVVIAATLVIGLVAVFTTVDFRNGIAIAVGINYCSPEAYSGAVVARDGQSLSGQPVGTQQLFQSAWGANAAARWVFEHNCSLGPNFRISNGPTLDYCAPEAFTGAIVARDGKALRFETLEVQSLFESTWGTDATSRWVFEHNCNLGSSYIPPPAPMDNYCPPEPYPDARIARDGQALGDQTIDVQLLFLDTWGTFAAPRWVWEHNCLLGPILTFTTTANQGTNQGSNQGRSGGQVQQNDNGVEVVVFPSPQPGEPAQPTPVPNNDEPEDSDNSDDSNDDNSNDGPDDNRVGSGNWQGYSSWAALCDAFFNYEVGADGAYAGGRNEYLLHPLFDGPKQLYLEECQRAPR